MSNTRNARLKKRFLGLVGYEFPYLLISVMIQSLSYTNTVYRVLFLPTEPGIILIGWLQFKRTFTFPSVSEGKVGGKKKGRERAVIHSRIH